ncbi:cysteine desulfurase family protein [Vibrio tapetis]|uniref:Cysteine desulfurase n=1 Tax=Vibrio tapetis subsp. tapetis TaxID=1671868 RepID=A0A2N8Z9E5_9VIBR|nr:cysteine desulfurase family protein [Vibrio tapetis]SON48538.1 Cysteine desulfurase [Vibrio tapetis subsp. tapetis]
MYLDYLASTPLCPEALQAMTTAWQELYANPSSNHACGKHSQELLQNCQRTIADKIGAEASEIIFTSGATEGNNLAIKGLAELNSTRGKHLITSQIEHSCVLNIFSFLEKQGFEVTYLKPSQMGIHTAQQIKEAIREDTILVSIMHVNNELGTINPIRDIGELCFSKDIVFHTDAAQSVAKLDIDVVDDYIDALSASAHKFGGPKGIGFLYLREARNLNIEPVIHGSGQQIGIRGGTIPTPLIVGMSVAFEYFKFGSDYLESLRNEFIATLDNLKVKYKINGTDTLSNVINLTFECDVDYVKYTSQAGICVSQGSACNSQHVEPSHVLTAMNISAEEAFNTVRISFYDNSILASAAIFN